MKLLRYGIINNMISEYSLAVYQKKKRKNNLFIKGQEFNSYGV